MFSVRFLLGLLLPMLEGLGQQFINKDANETGVDDIEGQAILFGVKIFRAYVAGDTAALQNLLPSSAKSVVVTAQHFNVPADPSQ